MEGIVPILKPPAMSSSDAVVDVRKLYDTKRVGHLGTLDPEAAGVLPVCVGRAVRLFDYLVDKHKEYVAEIAFGIATDSQDAQGEVIRRSDQIVMRTELEAVLPHFLGDIEQVAPMYSALKYNGKKLYDLARAGVQIPEKRRPVCIDRLELGEQTGENRFLLTIGCTRGTYIRTLCADIGDAIGVPAHMAFLLRTASGDFTLDHSYTIAELKEHKEHGTLGQTLISCEEALRFLPMHALAADRKKPTLNGLETTVRGAQDGTVRLYADGTFLGIGVIENGSARLTVNLYSETI